MTKKYTAQCACGAVKFEFNTDPNFIATCHCKDCKKASGGATATFFGVPEDDFTLISGKPKSFHYVAGSGKGLDRNFCPDCGARLFTTNLESFPGTVFVALGSLDRPDLVEPMLEMFTKRRLKWEKPLGVLQFSSMPPVDASPPDHSRRQERGAFRDGLDRTQPSVAAYWSAVEGKADHI